MECLMSRSLKKSSALFEEACAVIPGGVNSPVRAFRSVDGQPIFIKRALGSRLWDEDGNDYIDYIGSWGPAILGHAHPDVVGVISETASGGISFGAPTIRETELANTVQKLIPSMEMVRFVSSGTEACMSVLRVARAFTGRTKILKFEGCYHGHGDMLLVKAGSGAATMGVPDSAGVPTSVASDTLTVAFNDLGAVAGTFERYPEEVAAIIVEPIVGNSGFIRPAAGFLEGLRDLCDRYKALLIFDEVMTGFRVALGGVQSIHGITPDLTCLGKVIGGGMPIAAYGGRRDVMSQVAPLGPVYQAGTLSGNPVAVASGLKTIELISEHKFFECLSTKTKKLTDGLRLVAHSNKIDFYADCEGGMFGFFFQKGPVRNYLEAKSSNLELFKKFFWGMIAGGVYLAPSPFEAGFVSGAHSDADIEYTIELADKVMKGCR
jgi:glutamate-1-semialdehyde 2,1-aminomutase